jgi:hypothetical protein
MEEEVEMNSSGISLTSLLGDQEETAATPAHPFSRSSTVFAAVAASIFTVVGVAGNVKLHD